MVTLHEDVSIFMTISCWTLLRLRNILDEYLEKIKTHILCSITFFRKSYRFRDKVEMGGGAREAVNDMAHARCMLGK
jgi:hypothetical protein